MADEDSPAPRQNQVVNELVRRIKDFNLRIRELEESLQNLTGRVNTIENAMLEKTTNLKQEQGDHREEIKELKNDVSRLETALDTLKGKTRKLVTRREFNEVEQYMQLLDPVKSKFTTESQVEDIAENVAAEKIAEALDERQTLKGGNTQQDSEP